ncbi:thiol peroxidase (atypical 2-Cys peroxiredoxin) [Amycolatopsis tolypomycina]|uniref:Thiol peroxidase n=1 Tax=Amycolatopsis tolypomycina TaxID=208445 RepID=A0A1H4ZXQ1_9PSEU|nr:thiol peroxidase [Amycolatopsis tolypomycina]SED34889.1 thiol peroxidase (atypical 2-Cys peroxiredoxin) [Amycolatopsis tolypomycina]
MTERTGVVTFRGNPVTLLGPEIAVGDQAPDFTALATDMRPVRFSELGGTRVISVVPSLETPVCDLQTRRFNESVTQLGEATVLTMSVDLPFAQARWCGAAGVQGVQTLSDHRDVSFGLAYGVLIKEFRLLSRAVFVVDATGTVVHAEYVPEVGQEPNFDAAIVAAQGAETARTTEGRAA